MSPANGRVRLLLPQRLDQLFAVVQLPAGGAVSVGITVYPFVAREKQRTAT